MYHVMNQDECNIQQVQLNYYDYIYIYISDIEKVDFSLNKFRFHTIEKVLLIKKMMNV